MLIETSPPLQRRLLLVSSAGTQSQPEERLRPSGGINDLLFAGNPVNMFSDLLDSKVMVLYSKKPDWKRTPTRPTLELLRAVKDTVMSQMYLTQPPVSRVYTTWNYNGMCMEMELDNAAGVKIEDLIGHLEEYGRMPGMELVALCVTCTHAGRKRFRRDKSLWR